MGDTQKNLLGVQFIILHSMKDDKGEFNGGSLGDRFTGESILERVNELCYFHDLKKIAMDSLIEHLFELKELNILSKDVSGWYVSMQNVTIYYYDIVKMANVILLMDANNGMALNEDAFSITEDLKKAGGESSAN